MTPREEFHSAIEHLEETITQLSLLAKCFRRLEQDLWAEREPAENLQDAGQN